MLSVYCFCVFLPDLLCLPCPTHPLGHLPCINLLSTSGDACRGFDRFFLVLCIVRDSLLLIEHFLSDVPFFIRLPVSLNSDFCLTLNTLCWLVGLHYWTFILASFCL